MHKHTHTHIHFRFFFSFTFKSIARVSFDFDFWNQYIYAVAPKRQTLARPFMRPKKLSFDSAVSNSNTRHHKSVVWDRDKYEWIEKANVMIKVVVDSSSAKRKAFESYFWDTKSVNFSFFLLPSRSVSFSFFWKDWLMRSHQFIVCFGAKAAQSTYVHFCLFVSFLLVSNTHFVFIFSAFLSPSLFLSHQDETLFWSILQTKFSMKTKWTNK